MLLSAKGLPSLGEEFDAGFRSEVTDIVTPEFLDYLVTSVRDYRDIFGGPLYCRSSANGDSTGIGIYRSLDCGYDPNSIKSAFTNVVASYFSELAVDFRRRADIAPGFSVFFQPMVGTFTEKVYTDYRVANVSQAFTAPYSGNVRMGIPRSVGLVQFQNGIGSAVTNRIAPHIHFEDILEDDSRVLSQTVGLI